MHRRILKLASLCAAGALASAAAQAQVPTSSLQLYGLVGLYFGKMERSGGPASLVQLGQGGLTTSYWGVRGSEDIGNGTRVVFALESFFQPDNGSFGRNASDPAFSRNAYVGMEGGFGRFTAGRQTNPTYSNMALLSPFGGSTVFAPLVLQSFIGTYGGAIIGDTVWNNAFQYASPRVNGFAATAMYALGEVADKSSTANLGLHANYLSGPWTVALSAQRVRIPVTAPITQQKAYLAGIAYDFKVAKLYGSLGRTEASGIVNATRTHDIGVKVPVTKTGALLAEVARTKREATGKAETARTTASVGYDHRLSKRTDVYAVYSRDRLTGFDSANTFALGIRHTF
jgi:predicted porin